MRLGGYRINQHIKYKTPPPCANANKLLANYEIVIAMKFELILGEILR